MDPTPATANSTTVSVWRSAGRPPTLEASALMPLPLAQQTPGRRDSVNLWPTRRSTATFYANHVDGDARRRHRAASVRWLV